jgi:L-ascorbate metabolism protein UlaG (beta-lactamase superfamily)
MNKVTVCLLGAGAIKLSDGQKIVYVDAFSGYVRPFHVEKADLILLTHDDADHFGAHETAQVAQNTGALVVGPPGIAYPLLVNARLPAEQLHIVYPIHLQKPLTEDMRGVRLKVYQTRHFNDWEPPHVSYLVELAGKRFYITGDSSIMDDADPDLKHLDGVLPSLVPRDLSAPTVMDEHIAAIESVQKRFSPRYVIPNHLIHCDWTVEPLALKKEVEIRGLSGIVIMEDTRQVFEIG